MGRKLDRSFYARDTVTVARELLGHILCHRLPSGEIVGGRILETEAYLGADDPAAHSHGGRPTPRTQPMYGEAGFSYVYFIYGVYYCFNVVTMAPGIPEAVLIRAVEPWIGVPLQERERPGVKFHEIANGPGKLCLALQLARSHNELDLTRSREVWIEEGPGQVDPAAIVEGPRVGIDYAEDAVHWPLRFGLAGPGLSKPRFPV